MCWEQEIGELWNTPQPTSIQHPWIHQRWVAAFFAFVFSPSSEENTTFVRQGAFSLSGTSRKELFGKVRKQRNSSKCELTRKTLSLSSRPKRRRNETEAIETKEPRIFSRETVTFRKWQHRLPHSWAETEAKCVCFIPCHFTSRPLQLWHETPNDLFHGGKSAST